MNSPKPPKPMARSETFADNPKSKILFQIQNPKSAQRNPKPLTNKHHFHCL